MDDRIVSGQLGETWRELKSERLQAWTIEKVALHPREYLREVSGLGHVARVAHAQAPPAIRVRGDGVQEVGGGDAAGAVLAWWRL